MRSFGHWVRNQFRWELKPWLTWTVILGAISVWLGALPRQYSKLELLKAMNRMGDIARAFTGKTMLDFGSTAGYLGFQYFSWMSLMFAFYPLIGGSGAIAGEVEAKTIEALMAKPLSRASLYWGKFLALGVNTLAMVAASLLGLAAGMAVLRQSLGLRVWLGLFALTGVGALCFTGLAFLLSVTQRSVRQALTWGISIVTAEFAVKAVALGTNHPGWAQWSVFYHIDVSGVLGGSAFPWGSFVLVVAATVLLAGGAGFYFQRKDILV
jgi:ABC-2 type transport system permease protein